MKSARLCGRQQQPSSPSMRLKHFQEGNKPAAALGHTRGELRSLRDSSEPAEEDILVA
jgi:hypothetical protein